MSVNPDTLDPSQWGDIDEITTDLFGQSLVSNKDDALLTSMLARCQMIFQKMLKPYADVLPYAPADITEDLNECVNILVKIKWHISKTHWDDVKALREDFKTNFDAVVEDLKALPTKRTTPQSISASYSDSSILLKSIPFMTDSNGNMLPGF